jgi:hypothetical protein
MRTLAQTTPAQIEREKSFSSYHLTKDLIHCSLILRSEFGARNLSIHEREPAYSRTDILISVTLRAGNMNTANEKAIVPQYEVFKNLIAGAPIRMHRRHPFDLKFPLIPALVNIGHQRVRLSRSSSGSIQSEQVHSRRLREYLKDSGFGSILPLRSNILQTKEPIPTQNRIVIDTTYTPIGIAKCILSSQN